MPIPVTCPCGYQTQVKDHLAGYKTQCVKCRAVFRVPGTKIPTVVVLDEPEPEPLVLEPLDEPEPEPLLLEPLDEEEEPLALEPVEDEIKLMD